MGSEEPKAIGQGGCAALPLTTPEAIRTQLGSILASPEFQLPERGRAFLRYIVEEFSRVAPSESKPTPSPLKFLVATRG